MDEVYLYMRKCSTVAKEIWEDLNNNPQQQHTFKIKVSYDIAMITGKGFYHENVMSAYILEIQCGRFHKSGTTFNERGGGVLRPNR
jgi:hypothetical protein